MIAEQAHLRQRNNLHKLYIHRPKGDGIDICLTDSKDYYLSFLIKNALVNGEFMTQTAIASKLCNSCSSCTNIKDCIYNDDTVLYEKNPPEQGKIIYLPRKGIVGKFACAPLAAIPLREMLKYDFTLPNGYKKQWRVAVYALSEKEGNEAEALRYIKGLYDASIEEMSWMLAKETLHIEP